MTLGSQGSTRPLGRSGLEVSSLALGTMNFGSDWLGAGALEEKAAARLLDAALEAGVTLIDTADVYGRGASEKMLGRLLKGRRGRVLIATKTGGRMDPADPASGGLSRGRLLAAAEASLSRLRTDRIDLYMPHAPDPGAPLEETFSALARLVAAGKVRVVGLSNYPGRLVRAALKAPAAAGGARPEFLQAQYSLSARGVEEDGAPECLAAGMSILAWSPLAGGWLTGKYRRGTPRPPGGRRSGPGAFPPIPESRQEGLIEVLDRVARMEGLSPAQAALAWVRSRPGVASAVVGARTVEQLQENLAAPEGLSAEAMRLLDRASEVTAPRSVAGVRGRRAPPALPTGRRPAQGLAP